MYWLKTQVYSSSQLYTFINTQIWSYMDGPCMAIYRPYMDHICATYAYMGPTYGYRWAIYNPYVAIYGPYVKVYSWLELYTWVLNPFMIPIWSIYGLHMDHVWSYMVTYGPYMANMACGRSEGVIFSRRQANDIVKKNALGTAAAATFTSLKKCHFHCRGQVNFKNVILTEHGKHKKKCFLRSMGNTFSSFATPPQ